MNILLNLKSDLNNWTNEQMNSMLNNRQHIKWLLIKNKRYLIWNKYRSADGVPRAPRRLRLPELRVDQRHLGGRERATPEVVEVSEAGIDAQPGTQLVPGWLRGHPGEIHGGQLRAAETFDCFFHIVILFFVVKN